LKKPKSEPNQVSAAQRSAATAMKAHEAIGAAVAVIAARTEMAMLACAQPSAQASAEMALMLPEKMDAFAQSGEAMAAGAAEMAGQGALYASNEVAAATEA
jgi:hypothetical protein